MSFSITQIATNEEMAETDDRVLLPTTNSFTVAILEDEATGVPAINAPTPLQVGATPSVDLTGIDDIDGRSNLTSNVTYNWRRYGADGTTLYTEPSGPERPTSSRPTTRDTGSACR